MRFKRMSFSEIRPFVRYVQRIIIRQETYNTAKSDFEE